MLSEWLECELAVTVIDEDGGVQRGDFVALCLGEVFLFVDFVDFC